MATVSGTPKDFKSVYTGFDQQEVGLGTAQPKNPQTSDDAGAYATKSYRKKKIDKVLIGGLQSIRYAGFEHDPEPLVLAVAYESQYNTIIGYNLHYIPVRDRKKVLKLYIQSNMARIKAQQPMIVDYKKLQKAVPSLENCIRRYKVIGVKVVDSYPLLEWDQAIEKKGRWSNWHKQDQGRSVFKVVDDVFKRFMGADKPKKNKPKK